MSTDGRDATPDRRSPPFAAWVPSGTSTVIAQKTGTEGDSNRANNRWGRRLINIGWGKVLFQPNLATENILTTRNDIIRPFLFQIFVPICQKHRLVPTKRGALVASTPVQFAIGAFADVDISSILSVGRPSGPLSTRAARDVMRGLSQRWPTCRPLRAPRTRRGA
jgi:hypothetical protein